MARADWDEVKRLAADFRRAQLTSSSQKLSERNCIEIVSKLVELKLIDVTFTTDGKEYVTVQHVNKEIRDELYVNHGRVNLVDLSQSLKLDLTQIELRTAELIKSDKSNLHLVLGQLIERSYLDRMCEEINELLETKGQVHIGELAKSYDLPGDFLHRQLEKRLGSILKGQCHPSDPRLIFNQAFIGKWQAWMQGVMSAITRPTSLAPILSRCALPEALFFSVIDNLIRSKRIAGTVSGGQTASQATFIPALHSRSQNEWVESFYHQNGYLEYDNLVRLGITDPKGFVKRKYPSEPLAFLPSGCVGRVLTEQIDEAVGEALASGSWLDVMPILPTVFGTGDANQLLQDALKRRKEKCGQMASILCETMVASDFLLEQLRKGFNDQMQTKAEKDVTSGAYIKAQMDAKSKSGKYDAEDSKRDKKEERRKKAVGGKGGGGTQGRETKTKSTKKRAARRQVESSDSEPEESTAAKPGELDFLSLEEIQTQLSKQDLLKDAPEELVEAVATQFWPRLQKEYQQAVRSSFEASVANASQTRRKTHVGLQDKIAGLVGNLKQFEKGLGQFKSGEVQGALAKHLLRTLCTDVVNDIFAYLAQENMLQAGDKEMTAESRNKLLTKLPEEMHEHLRKLNKSLSGKGVDEFLAALETVLGSSVCDMVVKKPDKKKEKQVVSAHRQALIEQLTVCLDPAVTLHLSVIILFQTLTQCMLHASGKFVPQILLYLQPHLESEAYDTLHTYQGLVMKQLTITDEEDEELKDVKLQLEELTPKVKEIAVTTKKSVQKAADKEN